MNRRFSNFECLTYNSELDGVWPGFEDLDYEIWDV